jgi:hypothetical protein
LFRPAASVSEPSLIDSKQENLHALPEKKELPENHYQKKIKVARKILGCYQKALPEKSYQNFARKHYQKKGESEK